MTLTGDLRSGFGGGGFDLAGAFDDLGGLFAAVGLPSLSLDVDVELTIDGSATAGVGGSVDSLVAGLADLVGGLPVLDELLDPLTAAMRLPEVVAALDLDTLSAELLAAVRPTGPGLAPLVDAARHLGAVPSVGALADLLGPLGLDLRGPGATVGGLAGGLVGLVTVLGALLRVEALSRSLDEHAALVDRVLDAPRLTTLIDRVRATGGPHLADLLVGVDPDDPDLVELLAPPIEAYLALVGELTGALVRGLAFADAVIVDVDVAPRVVELGLASAALVASATAPVDGLVAALVPLVQPAVDLAVPDVGGRDALAAAAATMGDQLASIVDALPVGTVTGLVDDTLGPVLAPLAAVRAALDEVEALLGVVFEPLDAALRAIDLSAVANAIDQVVAPVADAIDTLASALTAAQGAIGDVVDGVHTALTPLRLDLTTAVGTVTAPFATVRDTLAGLDLGRLQADLAAEVERARAAVAAAPVQPVFDVAVGVVEVAADALALVPKAMLPDDLRHELEAACAPVEALDLEPTRIELHQQLTAMVDSLDASVLTAVDAGFRAVNEFLTEIDPHPHVDALEAGAFAALRDALDQLDPTTLLAPVLDALAEAQAAIGAIDLAALLTPIDEALDTVADAIAGIEPAELLRPVTDALAPATTAVREALHLDQIDRELDDAERAVTAFVAQLPIGDVADRIEGAWNDLVSELAGPGVGSSGGVARGLVTAALPGVDVGGWNEVWAWLRGERAGSTVVHDRLVRAAAVLDRVATAAGALAVPGLVTELTVTSDALRQAVAALPDGSRLRLRLTDPVVAARPGPELGLVTTNVARVQAALTAVARTVAPAAAPDRSEVDLTVGRLVASFAPLAPAAAAVRGWAEFVGVEPPGDGGPAGWRAALAALARELGPAAVLDPLRRALERLAARGDELVVALLAPVREAVATVDQVLDLLDGGPLVEQLVARQTDLVALVGGVRPAVVLASPLAALTTLQTTLADFDPLGPVRTLVDALTAEVTSFATDLAPTTLLAPVLGVYDELRALVGSFDPSVLLAPVLGLLDALSAIIDRGIDEVIDALRRLQTACESEGGPLPGVSLALSGGIGL